MKHIRLVSCASLVFLVGGCVRGETRLMAATCEKILAQDSPSDIDSFLRDADAKLADLDGPQNRFGMLVHDLQDPEAMQHKPALEYCLVQLKLHHRQRSFD